MNELDEQRDRRRDRLRRGGDDDHAQRAGTPGRVTLTGRMPPSAGSIARAVASELLGVAEGERGRQPAEADAVEAAAASVLPYLEQVQRAFGHHADEAADAAPDAAAKPGAGPDGER